MSNAAVAPHLRTPAALVLATLLAGCTLFPSHRFAAGAPVEVVRKALGPATAEYPLPQGGRQLEYASGEFAKATHKYAFDAHGKLMSGEQVLTEAHFATIAAGMGADEVLLRIGKPSVVWPLSRQKQLVWSYRYESPFCQWFMVGMGLDGRVVDTAYGEDPMCQVHD